MISQSPTISHFPIVDRGRGKRIKWKPWWKLFKAPQRGLNIFVQLSLMTHFDWKEKDFSFDKVWSQFFWQGWSKSAWDPWDVHEQAELCFQCKKRKLFYIYSGAIYRENRIDILIPAGRTTFLMYRRTVHPIYWRYLQLDRGDWIIRMLGCLKHRTKEEKLIIYRSVHTRVHQNSLPGDFVGQGFQDYFF